MFLNIELTQKSELKLPALLHVEDRFVASKPTIKITGTELPLRSEQCKHMGSGWGFHFSIFFLSLALTLSPAPGPGGRRGHISTEILAAWRDTQETRGEGPLVQVAQ